MSRAFPAPGFSQADAPLRLPARGTVRSDLRIQAGRQLRMSLWLMAVIAVALTATLLARPASSPSLTEFRGAPQNTRTASAGVPSSTAIR